MDEILNVNEVAKLLHSDARTIRRKAQNKDYPPGVCGKHGRYWLFNKSKLLDFIFAWQMNT